MQINKDIIIINDFYPDPFKIREQALSMAPFPIVNELPGQRTLGVPEEQSIEIKSRFEEILNTKITKWGFFKNRYDKNNTAFQLINKHDFNWVHHDDTDWAGVLYLTPDADPDSGTGFFTHKETGVYCWHPEDPTTDCNFSDDKDDFSKWQLNLEVKNQFNRLILYKSNLYHSSMKPGFGENYLNGRLTQVFFFNL